MGLAVYFQVLKDLHLHSFLCEYDQVQTSVFIFPHVDKELSLMVFVDKKVSKCIRKNKFYEN